MMKYLVAVILLVVISSCDSKKGGSESKTEIPGTVEGGVEFAAPMDGAEISSPVKIEMNVTGMQIEPAGMVNPGKGHHHLIIDGSFIEEGMPVPADSTHIHYGKGQTEAVIDLAAGEHSLTLQFADGVHTSYGSKWSKTIKINVKGD